METIHTAEGWTALPPQLMECMPLAKSIVNRRWMKATIDGVNGTGVPNDVDTFLNDYQFPLPTDLALLPGVTESLTRGETVYVGDSGTLRRAVTTLFRVFGLEPDIAFDKTMIDRPFVDHPDLPQKTLAEVLDPEFDNNTSQWATMLVLFGRNELPPDHIHPKVQLTYDVVAEWDAAQAEGQALDWPPDETILKQSLAYLNYCLKGYMDYVPTEGDGEDFCFLVAFGLMTIEEAVQRMPAVLGHESNRSVAMQHALQQTASGQLIDSRDHRVIQALALRYDLSENDFLYPEAVAKSWPMFWQFKSRAIALMNEVHQP